MAIDPRLPVIIGVGQVVQHAAGLEDALEPVDLMAEAARSAATDAGVGAVPAVDSVRIVQLLSWRYRDPAKLVADALGLSPKETVYTTPGGNTPQMLVNSTAGEIQRGELDIAILSGSETWRTRTKARKAGVSLPWRTEPEDAAPSRVIGAEFVMSHPAEIARKIFMPVQVYPMFETALRAEAGEAPDEHQRRVSELWARFSAVASENPYAWVQRKLSAEEIRTPGPTNRMIGLPYPKYMNSNNDVDMAAAIIMCSVEKARELGVSEDRWVFLHAGSDCHDTKYVSNRADLHSSPAVRLGGGRALELAGIGIDDVEVVDLYSCFPAAVQIGAAALGLDPERQLTRTGGLSFAGGPWNNYVMHAIATVVSDLRDRPGSYGLVWANGGYVTKHSFGVYSTTPPEGGTQLDGGAIQDEIDVLPTVELAEAADAAGAATVEAYTVMHDRDGSPELGIATCLIPDGRRAWGTTTDAGLLAALLEGEWVGRAVELDAEGLLHAE
jgi:acetyl-CoA C-acetyltransferase